MKKIVPILIILLAVSVYAAPAPHKIIINNATMECSTFWAGDECYGCNYPEGWETIGYEWETECPGGYTEVEPNRTCAPLKKEFCCTQGHSGANGNCDDMIINNAEEKCAFIIGNCTISEDWTAYDSTGTQEGLCPFEYEWVEDIECVLVDDVNETTDSGPTEAPIKKNPDNTPYVVLILAIVAAIAAFIALKKK